MPTAPGRTRAWSSGETLVGRADATEANQPGNFAGQKRRGTSRDTTPGDAMGAPQVRLLSEPGPACSGRRPPCAHLTRAPCLSGLFRRSDNRWAHGD